MTLPARAEAIGGPPLKKLSRKLLVKLGAGLAVAVGIMAAEPIALLERPADRPAPDAASASSGLRRAVILIHLIAGDDHHALERLEFPACLQQRPGPEHVRRIGAERIAVGLLHQGLRGQVEDDLRIGLP